ncbi:hypothetical protein A9R04_20520 [Nocardiopsis dassonvillei]|uniref:hypothetical protein n=1 Tax=Nocardiopsis dassonvillei TaxID=2014 RepID=UPI0008FCDF29|nr:hypothetical protein [Nocardiopsis dassonvillei]APC36910.1 hypothetical protein A9R04_20520 [Nocardiopsis dassonvillei]
MRFAHWFPLIPRPRPPADRLNARVERLAAAGRTARSGSGEQALAAAAQVYNGAALLASDVGLPELARDWCWEHAHAYLKHLPLNATMAQRALEPVVNLARLRIRAGNGTEAFAMLTTLSEGVHTATPTVIDDHELPLDQIVSSNESRAELHRWLWTVCLGDGMRALATEGRWQEAAEHAQRHGGIGDRLFDGRQVAVIAELMSGNPDGALATSKDSVVQEPWEKAVQTILMLWCHKESCGTTADDVETILDQARAAESHQVLFTTRLGVVATELSGSLREDASSLVSQLVSTVVRVQDGYATRDLLAAWEEKLTPRQLSKLVPVLRVSGLEQKACLEPVLHELRTAIDEANRRLDDRSVSV